MIQPVSLPIVSEPPGECTSGPSAVQPSGASPPSEAEGGSAWGRGTAIDAPGLYLHIPFCFHKCHYCDFYSIVERPGRDGDRQAAFTDALIAELAERVAQAPRRPRTIFVGGGTPTLLRPALWQKLLGAMDRLGLLAQVEEFTVEANPETVTPELIRVLAGGGVDRLSIGAQSFDPAALQALERWHDPASVPRSLEIARAAGIRRVNLDVIFAIPGQTLSGFAADLEAVLALEPSHISCYGLTYEPNTAMTVKLQRGRIEPAAEELETKMYRLAMDRLGAAGFEHYEISAWAQPGERSEHNLLYWRNQPWLGAGPAAASHLSGARWRNAPHLGRYLDGAPRPPVVDYEALSTEDAVGEALMMRLRLAEGVPADWAQRRLPVGTNRRVAAEQLVWQGLLLWDDTGLRLSDRGRMVADGVIGELL